MGRHLNCCHGFVGHPRWEGGTRRTAGLGVCAYGGEKNTSLLRQHVEVRWGDYINIIYAVGKSVCVQTASSFFFFLFLLQFQGFFWRLRSEGDA